MRIPKNLVQDFDLEQGADMEIKYHNHSLVIRPKKQKEYSLKELIKGITPKKSHKVIFDGQDVGKEKTIW